MGGRGASSSLAGGGGKKLKLGDSGAEANPQKPLGGPLTTPPEGPLNSKERLAYWNQADFKEWYWNKALDDRDRFVFNNADPIVERESEKAIMYRTDYGVKWVPKSVMLSPAEAAERLKTAVAKQRDRLDKYSNFVEQVKQAGVKGVRQRMSTFTIMKKAREQGMSDVVNKLYSDYRKS